MVEVSARISTNVRVIAAQAKVVDAERVKEGTSYTVHDKRLGGKQAIVFFSLCVSCVRFSVLLMLSLCSPTSVSVYPRGVGAGDLYGYGGLATSIEPTRQEAKFKY